METEVTTIRLPKGTIRRLRRLAHEESLRRESDVTWAAIIREIIATMLGPADPAQDEEE
jgi:hypothetical protein